MATLHQCYIQGVELQTNERSKRLGQPLSRLWWWCFVSIRSKTPKVCRQVDNDNDDDDDDDEGG